MVKETKMPYGKKKPMKNKEFTPCSHCKSPRACKMAGRCLKDAK